MIKDIPRLIIRMLRIHPKRIYLISKDPSSVRQEFNFSEAYQVFQFFEENHVNKFIIQNFNNMELREFIFEFLEKCNIFIDEEEEISE
ncbi:MAG: hypothetical protein ACXAAH_16300, partial [Promethearchaeota archaeon]